MKTIDRELLESLRDMYLEELKSLHNEWIESEMSYELYSIDSNYIKGKLDLIEDLLKD